MQIYRNVIFVALVITQECKRGGFEYATDLNRSSQHDIPLASFQVCVLIFCKLLTNKTLVGSKAERVAIKVVCF